MKLSIFLLKRGPTESTASYVWRNCRVEFICLAAVLAALLVTLLGCATATLDPQGMYRGNRFWYRSDRIITQSKSNFTVFLKYEQANRAYFKSNGITRVTASADFIRTNAPRWLSLAVSSRNLYTNLLLSANPDPAALSLASNNLWLSINTLSVHNEIAGTNTVHPLPKK